MRGTIHWLERPILGEGLAIEGDVVRDLHRRVAERVRDTFRPQIGEPRQPRTFKSRKIRSRPKVGPYAPQLIRLVRSPYKQALRRGRRVEIRERRIPVFVGDSASRIASPRIASLARREIPTGSPVPVRPRARFGARRWARGDWFDGDRS